MPLTLFGAPLSPFVRKVRLSLLEKRLEFTLEFVMPFAPPAWFLDLNPLGRVPAFKDDDLTLADSSVICQYLDEQYDQGPGLLGQSAAERARVRWLEKYADYEVAPHATFGVFRNRIVKPSAGHACDEAAVQKALDEKLPPHFDYLENQIDGSGYFVGDSLTLADIAVACQLINLEHGGEAVDATRWPRLAVHLKQMKARESLAGILPSEQRMIEKLRATQSSA